MPFREQANLGAIRTPSPMASLKNAVEVDKDVSADFRMLPIIDMERLEDRAAFIDVRARYLAQQRAHFGRISGQIQPQEQRLGGEGSLQQLAVSGVVGGIFATA